VFYFLLRTTLPGLSEFVQYWESIARILKPLTVSSARGVSPMHSQEFVGGGDNGDGQKDKRRPLAGFEGITAFFQRFQPSEG
jgi:hypothetical protein